MIHRPAVTGDQINAIGKLKAFMINGHYRRSISFKDHSGLESSSGRHHYTKIL
jgi:hypothetical protein